jgi:hypothetical protein
VSAVFSPPRPPPTMSSIGLKLPGGLNSSAVPSASPAASPAPPHALATHSNHRGHHSDSSADSIYNGHWFRRRPSVEDLRQDLRAVTREIRPDWDLRTPGLREVCDAGDHSPFHGWHRRARNPWRRSPDR